MQICNGEAPIQLQIFKSCELIERAHYLKNFENTLCAFEQLFAEWSLVHIKSYYKY